MFARQSPRSWCMTVAAAVGFKNALHANKLPTDRTVLFCKSSSLLKMPILEATEQDTPALTKLINQAYHGTDEEGNEGWSHEAKIVGGPRINAELYPEDLRPSENSAILKFEQDGEILGVIRVDCEGTEAYSGILSVKPSTQTRGIGSGLLVAAEKWAKGRGCTVIRLTVVNLRTELIQFYKRRGYEDSGVRKDFPTRHHGASRPLVPVHLIQLEKPLTN